MIKKIVLLAFSLHIWTGGMVAQGELQMGLLPQINISSKLSQNLKLVNSLASRHLFYQNKKATYNYELTDFTTILSGSFQPNQKWYVGYMIRQRGDTFFHRFIQRYALISSYDGFRLGHRVGIDQTFSNNTSVVFRTRYRILFEKALAGLEVNPREFYLKLGNEYLSAWQNNEHTLEVRLLAFLGYEINEKDKVEFGIDYRNNGLFEDGLTTQLWVGINWYTSFSSIKNYF